MTAKTDPGAPVHGWHFVQPDRTLAHTGEPVEVGRTYRVEGKIIPCQNGLHGSLQLIDALRYAESSILTRCSFGGIIVYQDDKLAASERTVLWAANIEPLLHEAACVFVEGALRFVKEPDPRSIAAIAAKRAWLRGEITDKELAAAWAAASAAAWDAARGAAWNAARNAAWDAARNAAWDAARDAARDGARAAAWNAAWTAVWTAQNDWLECAVREMAGVD